MSTSLSDSNIKYFSDKIRGRLIQSTTPLGWGRRGTNPLNINIPETLQVSKIHSSEFYSSQGGIAPCLLFTPKAISDIFYKLEWLNSDNLINLLNIDNPQTDLFGIISDSSKQAGKVKIIIDNTLALLIKAEKKKIEDFGQNSIYLIYGLLEFEYKANIYSAPLLLLPVLEFDIHKNAIKFVQQDDNAEFFINPAITEFFKQNGGINHFDPVNLNDSNYYVNKNEAEDFLTKLDSQVSDNQGISIKKNLFVTQIDGFTHIYFDKIWDPSRLNNNAKNLLQEKPIGIYENSDSIIEEQLKIYTLLDPTQELAIRKALNQNNGVTIIQGPPGTGKSEIVANILLHCIFTGKKALFVSCKKEALSVVTQKILKYEKQYIGQLDSAITISATDLVLELFNASNLYKKNLRDKSVGLKNKRIPSKEINPLDKKKLEDYESFHSNYISILTQGVEDKYYTNILYYFFKYYVLAFNNGDHWMLSGQAVFNGSFLPKDFYDLESIESELDNLKDFYDCQNHVSLRKINPGISFQDFVEIRSYLKPILESLEPYHDYTINDLDLSLKIIEIYDELKIIGNHNKYDTIRNVLTLSENLTNCRKTLAVATSTLFKDKESLVLDESSYPLNLKHVSLINNCFIHEFEFGIQSDISTILLHKYPQGLSIAEFILSSFLESLGESSLNDFEDKFNMIRSVYLRLKIKDTTNIQELNEIVSLKDFAILSFVDKFSNEKKNLNKKLKELLKNSIEISDSELVNLQKESYDTLINEIALFCNIPNIERILENNLNKIEFIITFLHNQGFGGEKVSLNNVDYLKFNEVHKLVLALYNVFDRTTLSLSSGGLLEILSNLSLELKNLEYLYNKNPNYFVELSLSEFATQSESLNLIYEQQCLIDTLTQEISKLTIVSVDIINGIYKSHGFVTNESLRLIVEKIDKGHEDIVKLYQFFELFPKTRSKILFSIDDKLINLLEYFKSTEYFDKHLFIKYAEFQKKYAKLVDLVGTEFEARITKLLGDKSRSFESLQAFIMINLSMYLLEKFIDGKGEYTLNIRDRVSKYKELIPVSFSQLYRDSLSNIITRVHTAATNLYSAIANTRNLSRRNFILETWSEINALYPVIIATPDEVSRYIPSDSDIFDYVIFDESSQMTLQMSIPSISRGKKFILIGDQDQMPPSRGQGLVEYSDSDSTDTDSSILDNVISLNRDISNVYTLGTHYRSKYYRLFQPSQEAIYKGKTTAIYEAHSTNHNPIEFVYCPLSAPRNLNTEVTSGDKKNMVSIIEKAKLLLQQSNSSTVLIIAMNLKMMDEIDNIVRAQYSELLPLVENSRLIVKNLETCQGQDVTHSIIYFHYDTLSHVPFFNDNFGSYKRLNVAITRQQESLIIFHTASRSDWVSKAQLKYDDVQSSDYSRKSGLLILKLFGAHNEVQESEINNKLSDISLYFDSPFEESFYNIIVSQKWFQDLGYKLVPQVSESKFRIDFGVYDPENHSYVLGIELDGAMYHSGLSKEFADLSRQSVLESKGWEIYRIWSTDWSNNIKKEISLLETILKQKKYRTK